MTYKVVGKPTGPFLAFKSKPVVPPKCPLCRPFPSVGDQIYVPTSWYIDRGEDDVHGGLATVVEVKDSFVTVAELPGRSFNWDWLQKHQEKLKKQFGNYRAHPDPDYGP